MNFKDFSKQIAFRQTFCLCLLSLCILASLPSAGSASLKDSDIHIHFSGKLKIPNSVDTKHFNRKYKDWTAAEIDTVQSLLKQIQKSIPGLESAAACGPDLYFVRVESLQDARYPQRIPDRPMQPSAAAGPDFVLVADQYFDDKYSFFRLHALTHELVHVVDLGDYLSYSPEWTKFAEGKITKYSTQYLAQKQEMRSSFVALYKQSGICPTFHASADLREAFAEFFVASKLENFDPGQHYKTRFADGFLPPSLQRVEFHKHIRAGDRGRVENRLDDALKEFKLAESVAPDSPSVQVRLATVYQEQKDYEHCFQSAARALRLMEENGVSEQDPSYQYAEKEGEWAYAYVYHNKLPHTAPPLKPSVSNQAVEEFCSGKSNVLNGYDAF